MALRTLSKSVPNILSALLLACLFAGAGAGAPAQTARTPVAPKQRPAVVTTPKQRPAVVTPPEPRPAVAATPQLIISEFRWAGLAGTSDEFVEIYNNGRSNVVVGATDGSAGYAVAKSDGTVLFTIPNGTVIPAGGHFLGCNSTPGVGYSLSSYPGGRSSPSTTAPTATRPSPASTPSPTTPASPSSTPRTRRTSRPPTASTPSAPRRSRTRSTGRGRASTRSTPCRVTTATSANSSSASRRTRATTRPTSSSPTRRAPA